MSLHARQQLRHLSEISTLLARFESVDRTLPAILSLMTRTLHVRSATLISNRSGRVQETGWKTEGTSPARSRLDEVHARNAYAYLTGTRAPGQESGADAAPAVGRLAFSSKGLRDGMVADERNHFVVLPLVVEGGRTFGALQVEGDLRLDETDLLFVNTVVQQLAIALDRQALLASRDAIVEASRTHATRRIAELQQVERVEHFFSDLSSMLADSLDYERTLAAVSRAAVPFLADVCFVDDASEGGTIVRIDATGADGLPELAAPAPRRLGKGEGQLQDEVLATGRSMVLPGPSGPGTAGDEEHALTMRAAGFESMMVVPLVTRGETLGALTFAMRGPGRRYSANDLDLAVEVARRTAIAIDHARLHRQAQRAVQARENVLNIVSHDLRNPLNALTVSVALLSDDLKEASGTATTRKALEIVERSIRRMNRMIGDLLDTASIDSGRLAIMKEEHVLHALVEEVLEASRPAALKGSVQLEARLPKQEVRVVCDRVRIVQALSNLIDNAIKFTPKGGSILVSAELQETEVRVAVSDTGAGIERRLLPFVFDRHFQARDTVTIGSGLGLYISKGIIESHGGILGVESELSKGSTFFFTLPLA